MIALYISIAAAILVILAELYYRAWRKRNPKAITHSELLAGMAKLGTVRPPASVLDENGRRVWSEKRGRLVKAPATWNDEPPAKVTEIKKNGTRYPSA